MEKDFWYEIMDGLDCFHDFYILIPIILLDLSFDGIIILLINRVGIEHLLIEVHGRFLSEGGFSFWIASSVYTKTRLKNSSKV